MHSADCLCLLLANSQDAARVVPAKLFEYIATGRPILVIAPKGEVWDILAGYHKAKLCVPNNLDGIVAAMQQVARRQSDVTTPSTVQEFSRPHQAAELAAVLTSVS
jgi:hypothetical protein